MSVNPTAWSMPRKCRIRRARASMGPWENEQAACGFAIGAKPQAARQKQLCSILAEVELGRFLVQRVAQELLVALGAQVHAHLLVVGGQFGDRSAGLEVLEQLAERFELV